MILASVSLFLLCGCKDNPPVDGGDEGNGSQTTTPTQDRMLLEASFLQHWYVMTWDDVRWDREMRILADAGIKYLVFTPLKDGDSQADYDSLEKCLQSATSLGIKVFVGTNTHQSWWDSTIGADWLNARMQEGVDIAGEAYRRFHSIYPSALYGWYWDWEVDNAAWTGRVEMLADAWNITLDGLSSLDASMPLLFSPFMAPSLGSPAGYRDFWKNMFARLHLRKGDIFAPQDCSGSYGLNPSTVKSWFYQLSEAAKTVQGLEFWANLELFRQFNLFGNAYFVTAPFSELPEQIKAVEPFVSKLMCFSYTHYYSSMQVRDGYHNAYLAFARDGSIPREDIPGRVNSATISVGSGVELRWHIITKTGVDGFSIYKNGELYIRLQVTGGEYPDYFYDYNGTKSDVYQICTYNILGDESARVSF